MQKTKKEKILKVVKISVISLLVLIVAVSGILTWLVVRPWPKTNGNLKVKGLQAQVSIIRDEFGIPNIYAENEYDLFFAQGYVTAQDRLFQMEMNRRIGSGTLSEMVGPGGIETDKMSRIYGLRRIAEESYDKLDKDTVSLLQAYSDGINAYIEANKNKLPLEFTILGCEPQPWVPLDIVSFSNFMAQINALNLNYELYYAQAMAKLGEKMTLDELPAWDTENPEIITKDLEDDSWRNTVTAEASKLDKNMLLQDNYQSGNNDWLKDVNITGPDFANDFLAQTQQFGWASGTWAVSGEYTDTGKPILACDAHMALSIPSFWYEVGLHGGRFDMSGHSLPGAPFILLGRNKDISWGFVNLNPDVTDLYMETLDNAENPMQYQHKGEWFDLEKKQEIINVKGSTPVTMDLMFTNHGPIVNDWFKISKEEEEMVKTGGEGIHARSKWESEEPIAMRWAVADGCYILDAISKLNRAGNWEEFRAALSTWDSLGESFIYADNQGNIGYQSAAKIPIRADKHLGVIPVSGSSGDYEWEGYIPFEELPSLFNPPTGYVAAVNNKTTTDDYPYPFTYDWFHPGYRARTAVTKLDEMIASGEKITEEDMRSLQADEYSYAAHQISAYLKVVEPKNSREEAALGYVKQWDGYYAEDSIGASIYATWYSYMEANTFFDERASEENWGFQFPLKHIQSLVKIMKEPDNQWFDDTATTDVTETRDDMVNKSFEQAMTFLEKEYGDNPEKWELSRTQTTTLNHSLFGGIPYVGKLYESKTLPFAGSPTSIAFAFCNLIPPDRFNVSFASTQRHMVSYDDPDNMQSVISSGESGHLFHPHRQDQMELWAGTQYHSMPITKEAVEKAGKDTLTLLPAEEK